MVTSPRYYRPHHYSAEACQSNCPLAHSMASTQRLLPPPATLRVAVLPAVARLDPCAILRSRYHCASLLINGPTQALSLTCRTQCACQDKAKVRCNNAHRPIHRDWLAANFPRRRKYSSSVSLLFRGVFVKVAIIVFCIVSRHLSKLAHGGHATA